MSKWFTNSKVLLWIVDIIGVIDNSFPSPYLGLAYPLGTVGTVSRSMENGPGKCLIVIYFKIRRKINIIMTI